MKLVLFEETKDYYQGCGHEGQRDKVRVFTQGLIDIWKRTGNKLAQESYLNLVISSLSRGYSTNRCENGKVCRRISWIHQRFYGIKAAFTQVK